MSKLYKNLEYETDLVSQPGDPITSPDGTTSVSANNDGTITVTKGASTNTVATQAYVNTQIGDINSVLDAINGEVI